MTATKNTTARKGLRGWWASPPRSGLRLMIAPYEYRHLRTWARVRIGVATVLAALGLITLALGGTGAKAYGFATIFLAAATAHAAYASWLLSIARSRAPGA